MSQKVEIAKVSEDEQLVFGWAWISKDADGDIIIDHHGDVIEPDELEPAAYTFVLEARDSGEMHTGEANGKLVESMVFTPEKMAALGLPESQFVGWWTGFHIEDPEVFGKVKSQDYLMFSVQGLAETD